MKCCPICDREYAEDLSRCPQDGAILRRPAPKSNRFEGQIIKGRYRVISKLGQGGMGSVYLAEQKWMARQVALKILNEDLAQDDALVTRFRLEARLAGNLDHRNIPRVYDFDQTEDGSLFIVMEYVEGRTLTLLIREHGRLEVNRALRLAIQVAEGLQAAHRKDVLHRDIKPDNVMVDTGDVVKLMDFGVARLRAAEGARVTKVGFMVGTPQYMAPEQLEGDEVSERTDLYSLGIVVYEMLTGELPFKAQTPGEAIHRKLHLAPAPPRQLRGDIPETVEGLVLQMLEKDPARRPRDAAEVVSRLRAIIRERDPSELGVGGPRRRSVDDETRPLPKLDAAVAPGSSSVSARPADPDATVVLAPGSLVTPGSPEHARVSTPSAGAAASGDPVNVVDHRAPETTVRPRLHRLSVRMPIAAAVIALVVGLGGSAWWLAKGREASVGPGPIISSRTTDTVPPRDSEDRDREHRANEPATRRVETLAVPPPASVALDSPQASVAPDPPPQKLSPVSGSAATSDKPEPRQRPSRAGEDHNRPGPPGVAVATPAVTTREEKAPVPPTEPSHPSPASIKAEVERQLRRARLGHLHVQVDGQRNVVVMGVTETSAEKDTATTVARAVDGAAGVRVFINVRVPESEPSPSSAPASR
jgi:serine/threonine-protein kinase